jgi:hypothetical protein
MLRPLSLLQMHREWSGADLADRLGVTVRTVRRDINRLRELAARWRRTGGAGQVLQLLLFGFVEVQGAGEGVEAGVVSCDSPVRRDQGEGRKRAR